MVGGPLRGAVAFALAALLAPGVLAGPVAEAEADVLAQEQAAVAAVAPYVPDAAWGAYDDTVGPHEWAPDWAWLTAHGPLATVDGAVGGSSQAVDEGYQAAVQAARAQLAAGYGIAADQATPALDLLDAAAYQALRAAVGDAPDEATATGRSDAAIGHGFSCLAHAGDLACTTTETNGYTYPSADWTQITGRSLGDVLVARASDLDLCMLLSSGTIECQSAGSDPIWSYSGGDAIATAAIPDCYVTADGNGRCLGYAYTGGDATDVSSAGFLACYTLASHDLDCHGATGRQITARWDYYKTGDVAQALLAEDDLLCLVRLDGRGSCMVFDAPFTGEVVLAEGAFGLAQSSQGTCILAPGPDPCVGYRGWQAGPCEECNNPSSTPDDPFPDQEPVRAAFGLGDACWFYADGTSYCERDGSPPGGPLDDNLPALPTFGQLDALDPLVHYGELEPGTVVVGLVVFGAEYGSTVVLRSAASGYTDVYVISDREYTALRLLLGRPYGMPQHLPLPAP